MLFLSHRDEEEHEPAAPVKDAIAKAMEKSEEAEAEPTEGAQENGIGEGESEKRMEVEAT